MKEDAPASAKPSYTSDPEAPCEDLEERYFLAMTNDCADPDDGTLRTHEQIQEDWKLLGIIK